jgi:hypothetical protein
MVPVAALKDKPLEIAGEIESNKLTKLLAVAIFLVSLNAFSVALTPLITISTNHVSATSGTTITPVTITNIGEPALLYSISPAISNGL